MCVYACVRVCAGVCGCVCVYVYVREGGGWHTFVEIGLVKVIWSRNIHVVEAGNLRAKLSVQTLFNREHSLFFFSSSLSIPNLRLYIILPFFSFSFFLPLGILLSRFRHAGKRGQLGSLTFRCPLKCWSSLISRRARLARIFLLKTLVTFLMATPSFVWLFTAALWLGAQRRAKGQQPAYTLCGWFLCRVSSQG